MEVNCVKIPAEPIPPPPPTYSVTLTGLSQAEFEAVKLLGCYDASIPERIEQLQGISSHFDRKPMHDVLVALARACSAPAVVA